MADQLFRMVVGGMTCTGCEAHVARALAEVGATEVRADFRRGEASFAAPPTASHEALADAVRAAGYRPEVMELVRAAPQQPGPRGVGGRDGYDLAVVGERGEIRFDDHGRTINPRAFAAGDVTPRPQFVYVAAYEGALAAENAPRGRSGGWTCGSCRRRLVDHRGREKSDLGLAARRGDVAAGGGAVSRSRAMTIGQLSRRTGVPIKVLREYEGLGFLYTLGRSESNYRLFGDEALWCVQVVQGLRSLGLTLREIQDIVAAYLERPGEPLGALLDEKLARAAARVEARIADLQALRRRILDFRDAETGAQAHPSDLARLFASDPRRAAPAPAS